MPNLSRDPLIRKLGTTWGV